MKRNMGRERSLDRKKERKDLERTSKRGKGIVEENGGNWDQHSDGI